MKRMNPGHLLLAAAAALALPLQAADFELKDAQGRRILLKEDGSWRYVDAAPAAAPASAPVPAPPPAQAELLLERRQDAPGGCRFELALNNSLGYEIRSLVPELTVYRSQAGKDVPYSAQLVGFGPVRPGDAHRRALQFAGIACAEVSRLQVGGGERCEMGDLNKFSDAPGQCLARLKVMPSELLRFDKTPPAKS